MDIENENEASAATEGGEAIVEETPEFDSGAFIENGESTTPTGNNDNDSGDSDNSGDSDGDDGSGDADGEFGWDNPDASTNDADSDKEPDGNDGDGDDGGSDADTPPANDDGNSAKADADTDTSTIDYASIGEEYGFEGVETKEDLDKHINELKDNAKIYKELADDSLTNDTIKKLSSYQKLSSEDLVRRDLELQGITGEKLEDAIDVLSSNGTLSIEADKIRHNVDRAIDSEREKIVTSRKDADAKQLQDHEDSIKELKSYLDETDTMLGFKMAKDPEKLQAVRDDHHRYVTSGDFLKEITGDNSSIAEAAWLWRHRDTLIKAIANKGNQSGKKEVLDNLGNHEATGQKRIIAPDGSREFNANKFNA